MSPRVSQGRSLYKAASPALSAEQRFVAKCFIEGWQYGAGMDYTPPERPRPLVADELAIAKRAAAAARAFRPAAADRMAAAAQ